MEYQLSTDLILDADAITFLRDVAGQAYFVKCAGPTRLLWRGEVISGHDLSRHPQGFSAPIGLPNALSSARTWQAVTDRVLIDSGLVKGNRVDWRYESGVVLKAKYLGSLRLDDVLVLMTFDDCSITGPNGELLYDPTWGEFDLALAQ